MKTSRRLGILQLIVAYFLHNTVECHSYERCSTHEGHPGVCVLKRFCRMASSFPNTQHTRCPPSPDELLCCPLPTRGSSPTPKSIPRVSTPASIRPFFSSGGQNPKIRHPNLPSASYQGHHDHHEESSPGSSREGPHGRPQDDRYSSESSKDEDRRFTSVQGDRKPEFSAPKKEQRTRSPQRRPDRSKTSTPRPQVRPRPDSSRNHNSTDSIRFSESFQASFPHPPAPACGGKPFKHFIAGGGESEEHEWPWMAAIFRRSQGMGPKSFVCGGSLINARYILGAAHCFVHNYVTLPASLYLVRLGAHNLNQGEEYTVAKIVVHENHSASDFFNDIALLRLASEVYFTDKIAPICLPTPSMAFESFIGRMATVAGWGETAFRSRASVVLRHVTVPVVPGDDCSAAYSRVGGAAFLARGTDHVICAGLQTGGKDACLGDSGGPLMIKMENDDLWTVIGIVSLGYKCAEPDYPGVYTRVTHYLTWIYSNMKRY